MQKAYIIITCDFRARSASFPLRRIFVVLRLSVFIRML